MSTPDDSHRPVTEKIIAIPVPSPFPEARCTAAEGDTEPAAVGAAADAFGGPKVKPSRHTDPRLAGKMTPRLAACARSSTLQPSKAAVAYCSELFCDAPGGLLSGRLQRWVLFASSSCIWMAGHDPSGVKAPAHADSTGPNKLMPLARLMATPGKQTQTLAVDSPL